MNIEQFNSINNLYKELCAKADTIRKSIKSEGYDYTLTTIQLKWINHL